MRIATFQLSQKMETVRRSILKRLRLPLLLAAIAPWIANLQAQLGLPPVIVVQPLGLSVLNGDRIVLATTAVSLTAMNFNWRLNGQNLSLSNASVVNVVVPLVGTISTLTVSNAIPAYAGQYSVQVVNAVGSALSSNVTVSVLGGIAVDQVSSARTNSQTLRWTHTVGSGLNRALLVTVAYRDSDERVESVRYGDTPLLRIATAEVSDKDNGCSIWGLLNPPSGSAEVTVTAEGAQNIAAGAISLNGVVQTDPVRSIGENENDKGQPSVSQEASPGDVVLSVLSTQGDAGSATPGGGQFLQWNQQTGTGGNNVIGASSIEAGANQVSTHWTLNRSKKWALAAVALKPAASSPIAIQVSGANLGLTTNGFKINLTGPTGSTFIIEASDNLLNWIPVSTNIAPGGSASFTDLSALQRERRYYKVRLQ